MLCMCVGADDRRVRLLGDRFRLKLLPFLILMFRQCMRGSYTEDYISKARKKVPERRTAGQPFTQESRLRTGVPGDFARKHGEIVRSNSPRR